MATGRSSPSDGVLLMESRWNEDGARRALDEWGPKVGETLALRTYTARLLGSDPALVLHGGGNTSAKGRLRPSLGGEEIDVLFIKGSGGDLATIDPERGHPAVELGPLLRLRGRASLTDEDMVAEQRRRLLDPSASNPSIECLLHAFLPHPFVDHTHADAVLALADQPDAERVCREVYGSGLVFVPYVKPGFDLAKACAAAYDASLGTAEVIILERHGIFTFGPDAKTSYERMIDAVSRAERRCGRAADSTSVETAGHDPALRRRIAPVLRGALGRALGRPIVLSFDESAEARAFATSEAERPLASRRSQRGPATPDHVIRTKPWPMVASEPDAPQGALDEYAARYRAYVAAGIEARGPRIALDAVPRVVLVPRVGVCTIGATRKEAEIAGEVYAHTRWVIDAAFRVGDYQPVGPVDLFDLEYWSLEQAKLGKQPAPGPLGGQVALITGAASGIGRATAEAMLAAGAHVLLADCDPSALSDTRVRLAARFGGRADACFLDVTDRASVVAAVEACVDAFGGVDVVVSNAGTAPQGLLHEDEGDRALSASLEVNLLGHQHLCRAVAPIMIAQGTGGALLFNASKAAFNPGPSFGPYAVAKAATVALMRQYAIDLGRYGIRANAVNADRIRTGLFGGGVLEARARARGLDPDAYFRANLLDREVTADDVAASFVYLATARSTTGCIVTVDGGNAAAFPR